MQAVGLVDQQSPSPRGHVVKTIGDFLQTLKLSVKENKVLSFHLFNNILLLFPHFCAHFCAFSCFIRRGALCSKTLVATVKRGRIYYPLKNKACDSDCPRFWENSSTFS